MNIFRSLIKNNQILAKAYKLIRPHFVSVTSSISFPLCTKMLYYESYGRFPNLNNPHKFSEKLMWLLLNVYSKDPLVTKCADKLAVREYVKEKGFSHLLNEIYGVWDKVEDIDWASLPEKFVLKCNHGAGYNILCYSKSELDIEEAKCKLSRWISEDYWKRSGELFYKNIRKKIFCEKYIETENNIPPKDYKIFCSYGEPQFLYVAWDRINDQVKYDFYTCEWEWIPVKCGHPNSGLIPKPENLQELLDIARKLSGNWPQVRVDLYSEKNEIIFGELTFLHAAGKPHFGPEEFDDIFGNYFKLPIN